MATIRRLMQQIARIAVRLRSVSWGVAFTVNSSSGAGRGSPGQLG
jgi:hypothetical protein